MNYEDIIPTHNSLRNPASFFVFLDKPSLITNATTKPLLLKTEDDKLYLNDGHHRLTAAYHLGIPITDIEFNYASYTYLDLLTPNFEIGWLTPYDPRVNVRRSDCLKFKNTIREYLKECGNTLDAKRMAEWLMRHFPQMYLEQRIANSLKDLIPNGTHPTK